MNLFEKLRNLRGIGQNVGKKGMLSEEVIQACEQANKNGKIAGFNFNDKYVVIPSGADFCGAYFAAIEQINEGHNVITSENFDELSSFHKNTTIDGIDIDNRMNMDYHAKDILVNGKVDDIQKMDLVTTYNVYETLSKSDMMKEDAAIVNGILCKKIRDWSTSGQYDSAELAKSDIYHVSALDGLVGFIERENKSGKVSVDMERLKASRERVEGACLSSISNQDVNNLNDKSEKFIRNLTKKYPQHGSSSRINEVLNAKAAKINSHSVRSN